MLILRPAASRDLQSWIFSNETLFSAAKGTTAMPFLGEERLRLYISNVQAYIDLLRCITRPRLHLQTMRMTAQ